MDASLPVTIRRVKAQEGHNNVTHFHRIVIPRAVREAESRRDPVFSFFVTGTYFVKTPIGFRNSVSIVSSSRELSAKRRAGGTSCFLLLATDTHFVETPIGFFVDSAFLI